MPTTQEFNEALGKIESYIPDTGDEIEEHISERISEAEAETDDLDAIHLWGSFRLNIPEDEELDGFFCSHGDNYYFVTGSSDSRFFNLHYLVDFTYEIASVLSDDQAANILEESVSDLESNAKEGEIEEYRLEAAKEFLVSLDEDDIRELQFYLTDRLSDPEVAYRTFSDEYNGADLFVGYGVSKKLYPYREDFDILEYNDAVQAVVSVGYNAFRYLSNAFIFDLSDKEKETTVGERINIHP